METDENTQTSGRLKRVAPYLGDEDFCFTYGDGVANVNIRELVKLNCSKKVKANLTCVQPPGAVRYLTMDDKVLITKFMEKPKGDGGWMNGGFFVLSPSVIGYIDSDLTAWESEPLERLAREPQLAAY